MDALPDDALVVRGGLNLPENFEQGSGVSIREDGKLESVSVNCSPGATIQELTAPNKQTGYIGIKNNKVGVTTVGKIRSAGGEVIASATKKNPHHATISGLTPAQASELFSPTIPNPALAKK